MYGLKVLLAALLPLSAMQSAETPFAAETRKWREQAESRLKADDGWLTVAGLFWLKEGVNRIGSSEENQIVLPASAPARMGSIEFRGGVATFRVEGGVAVTFQGKPVSSRVLQSDAGGARPDVLVSGGLSFFVIKRGERFAVRLRDKNSKMRREFSGRTWFPPQESYRIVARWVPYNPPRTLAVPNILGETERQPCPGVAVFQWKGAEHRLEPVLEDGRLFFIFKDRTAGKKTYPAGRFLYSEVGPNNTVVLDFNRAYNPPCAFTPYATCPLPPRQNHLAVAIEAGELTYHHD